LAGGSLGRFPVIRRHNVTKLALKYSYQRFKNNFVSPKDALRAEVFSFDAVVFTPTQRRLFIIPFGNSRFRA
jgi:hypothetical protein